jgi:hypothetical protein
MIDHLGVLPARRRNCHPEGWRRDGPAVTALHHSKVIIMIPFDFGAQYDISLMKISTYIYDLNAKWPGEETAQRRRNS